MGVQGHHEGSWRVGTFLTPLSLCNIFPASLASFAIITIGYTWASYDASAFVLLTVSFIPSHNCVPLRFP